MRGLKSQWRIHQLSHKKNGGTSKVDLPFEFRVLEICQKFVCKCLESEASTLEQEAYPALDDLSVSVRTLNLQRVRIIKSSCCSARVQKVRDELEHLLDDDMDMAEMYLTYKHNKWHAEEPEPKDDAEDDSDEDGGGGNRSSSADLSGQKPKVEELEMLLEAYFAQLEGALSKLSTELTLDLSLQLIDLWLLRLDQMKDASRGTLLLFMQRCPSVVLPLLEEIFLSKFECSQMPHPGKVAIVTASTQGIGLSIAEWLGLEGASVDRIM